MTPKPLTPERRHSIQALLRRMDDGLDGPFDWKWAIKEVLAAEQFWREAVKNADEFPCDKCAFCMDAPAYTHNKADCPWLLAQRDPAE